MTEIEMSCELTMAFSDFRQNSVLASIVSGCLAELGAPEWTEADYALAKKFPPLKTGPLSCKIKGKRRVP